MEDTIKEDDTQSNESNTKSSNENDPDSKVLEFFEESSKEESPNLSNNLLLLYNLTKIDGELEEIEDVKGDLPEKIKVLEEHVKDVENKISLNQIKVKELSDEENELLEENKLSEDRMEKYDEQKYNVRSNKEYDDIMKAIDSCFEIIEKNEERIKEIKTIIEEINIETEELKTKDDEVKIELEENQKSLNELNKQFEKEEIDLKSRRNEILSKIGVENKHLYEKLNRTYKGEATAIVRNGNCSGCFNSIPPQREIEIRSALEIYTCQSCGRILIDESLIKNDS